MSKPKSGFWKANQGFATTYEGEPLFVQKGELVRHGHPLLKGREELFDPAETVSRFDEIEQATAAPGEKRGRRRSKPETEPEAEPEPEKAPFFDEPAKQFGLTTQRKNNDDEDDGA